MKFVTLKNSYSFFLANLSGFIGSFLFFFSVSASCYNGNYYNNPFIESAYPPKYPTYGSPPGVRNSCFGCIGTQAPIYVKPQPTGVVEKTNGESKYYRQISGLESYAESVKEESPELYQKLNATIGALKTERENYKLFVKYTIISGVGLFLISSFLPDNSSEKNITALLGGTMVVAAPFGFLFSNNVSEQGYQRFIDVNNQENTNRKLELTTKWNF